MISGPLELVARMAEILDGRAIPYVLGGSVATSFFGEPRSTVDVDVAIALGVTGEGQLLTALQAYFYVPMDSALVAIETRGSFNLLDAHTASKVHLFVLGDGLLDRLQIERRVRVPLPRTNESVWVSSPEDQVLRKLDWFRLGGEVSDRQWRDVVGILKVQVGALDIGYMRSIAVEVGLGESLEEAIRSAASTG